MYRMYVLLAALFFLAPVTHALVPTGIESFTISVSPQYPRPYEVVTVTLKSSLIDLISSNVTISGNGAVLDEGIGVRSASTIMGAPGESVRITAVVVANGQTLTRELVLRPSDVALVMEAATEIHPFYLGASLPAPEGRLRLVALTHFENSSGGVIPKENLIYTWRLGEQVLENESGAGKFVLTASAPIRYRDARVSVTVTTPDKSLAGEASVLVTPVDPLVRIYRNDPLLGIRYEEALAGSVALSGDEETFRVIPYYFSAPPVLSWTINSIEQNAGADITLRATGGGIGSASVGVSARNPNAFQSAAQTLTVKFGKERPSNFLGF